MTPETTLPRFLLMTASAKMPGSCKGVYRRIAIVETDGTGVKPALISERAKGVKRIVKTWEALNVGKTDRSAYAVALAEATDLCAKMNAT